MKKLTKHEVMAADFAVTPKKAQEMTRQSLAKKHLKASLDKTWVVMPDGTVEFVSK